MARTVAIVFWGLCVTYTLRSEFNMRSGTLGSVVRVLRVGSRLETAAKPSRKPSRLLGTLLVTCRAKTEVSLDSQGCEG